MTVTPHAVFRCDASRDVGGGHAVRCLSLAEALSSAGWKCSFAVNPGACDTVPALRRDSAEIAVVGGGPHAEADGLMAQWPAGVELLIVDHYGRDADFEERCASWAKTIVVIDDLANRRHECSLLLDQSLGRREADYAGLVPPACRLLLGPQYALLRPQFLAARPKSLAKRRTSRRVQRILVSVGAVDSDNFTEKALDGIAQSGLDATVDIVLGSSEKKNALTDRIARLPIGASIHVGVSDMAELMFLADLSIGAAGSTSWERCALGLPSLIVITADNQRKIAAELTACGAARLLGEASSVTSPVIAETLRNLQQAELADMSRRAAEVCDAAGATRVATVLTELSNQGH